MSDVSPKSLFRLGDEVDICFGPHTGARGKITRVHDKIKTGRHAGKQSYQVLVTKQVQGAKRPEIRRYEVWIEEHYLVSNGLDVILALLPR